MAQRITREPKALLAAAGFRVSTTGRPSLLRLGGHLQYPAAGAGDGLRDRKIANIESVAPDLSRPAISLHDPARRRHQAAPISTPSKLPRLGDGGRSLLPWQDARRLGAPLPAR